MTLLLTLLVKSLLVFALAGAALGVLRRASAAARHLVCLLTLAAMLALPLFSVLLPGWHLRVLEPTPARSSLSPPETGRVGVGAGLASGLKASPVLETPHASETPDVPEPLRPPILGGPLRSHLLQSKEVGFLTLYLLGCLLASLRPLLGLWGIARLDHQCTDITDPPTLTAAAHCAETLHLRTPCLCRGDVSVPMTWGWRHPIILLSKESVEWPQDKLQSVLLHEMAHIKRHDWLSHRLADFVCAVYWFHPLVWLTARRLRTESELACDDLVLTSGIAASEYARHLLEIAGTLHPASTAPQAAIAMAQTSHVEERILMIVDKTRTRRTFTRRVLLLTLIPVTAVLVTLAVMRPTAKAQAVSLLAQTPGANGPVQIVGIVDAIVPNGNAWGPDGKALAAPVFSHYWGPVTKFLAKPGQKALFLVFHLSKSLMHTPVLYDVSGTTFDGITMTRLGSTPGKKIGLVTETMRSIQMQSSDNTVIYGAAFPASLAQTNIRVGADSGPWVKALTLYYNFKRGYPAVNISGGQYAGAIDLSGDTFKYSLPTKTPDDFYAIRFIVVDKTGHETLLPAIKTESKGGREQSTVRQPKILSLIREIRIEARPLVWTEFKDVALQSVK